MRHRLIVSMSGCGYRTCFEVTSRWAEFATPPSDVVVGMDLIPSHELAHWRTVMRDASRESIANWFDDDYNGLQSIAFTPGCEAMNLSIRAAFETAREALALVEPLPFEICAAGSVFFDQWLAADYRQWGFARGHVPHGWGCLFRGAGHDRLVSRRWLDFGPWRVVRRPNDTTFVQFHDLAITDPSEAYEQAKVGHQRMGVDPTGGFIQGIDLEVISQVDGLYLADQHTLEIVVGPGNTVRQQDMRVACGLRLHHRLANVTARRIERIAYVFMDRGDAEAHLHELWLRELECWYVDEHGKHRLDATYRPTPTPPAWVANLDASPANQV